MIIQRNLVKTLLIIPAYNEEESLKATIDSVQKEAPDVDFLIVNDGSTDGTERVCRENHYPFLDLATNLGLAGAFQAGLKYAYRHNYDCAIQFDADGQHLPEYIVELRDAVKILRHRYWIALHRSKKAQFAAHVWKQFDPMVNQGHYREEYYRPHFRHEGIQQAHDRLYG